MAMAMEPTIGRIVHYRPKHEDPPGVWAGSPEFLPAIVTRVLQNTVGVNLKVFCDGPGIVHVTNVTAGDAPGQWQWPRGV